MCVITRQLIRDILRSTWGYIQVLLSKLWTHFRLLFLHFSNLFRVLSSSKYFNTNTYSGHRPFKCPTCEFTAMQKSNLQRHMKTHSKEVKPHPCPTCMFRAGCKSDLIIHQRIHTGEKPYKCDECPYRGPSSSCLATHKRKHSNYRPFACKTCEYRTKFLSSLKIHERAHSGEKPLPPAGSWIFLNNLHFFVKWHTGICLTKWKEFGDVLHVLIKYYFQLFTSQRYILTAIFLFPGPYLISKWTFFGEKWPWTFSSKKTRLTKWKFLPICNFFDFLFTQRWIRTQ